MDTRSGRFISSYCLFFLAIYLFTNLIVYGSNFNFDEEYVFSDDKAATLKQLIPGTENYFYYNCLYNQSNKDFAEVEKLLKKWINRYGYTTKVEEIRNRQALLQFDGNSSKTMNFIKDRLNLHFNHQKKHLKKETSYSSKLYQPSISYESFKKVALSRHRDLSGFEDIALERLLDDDLNANRLRKLLSRMKRPEGDNLVDLIVSDLHHRYSGGFGSLAIHRKLLLSQLNELRVKMPSIINQTNYVNEVLSRLKPGDDENWKYDPKLKEAFLNRIWEFAMILPPSFNSLKANILYNLLDLKQKRGEFNKEEFLKYIKLPKNTSYMNRKYLKLRENRRNRCNLRSNFQNYTLTLPIRYDEGLVKNQLKHFMLIDKGFSDFEKYVDYNYLKKLFAKTMIVNGIGDIEKWYSMLSPQEVKDLRKSVEITFLPTCKQRFKDNETVYTDVKIKNVKSLIVKIYKINLFNYYNENKKEISTSLDLDGLIANVENKYTYDKPDYIAHNENFKFPEIKKNGAYVIEVIGNGKSSRALIRKGQLSFETRDSSAGQVFTIFDENHKFVADASIWMAGTEYKADKYGYITLPYSNTPSKKKIIIKRGDFAALYDFNNKSENYNLTGGFFVDRESLIEGRKAKLIFHPSLTINNTPISISYLKDVSLTINTTDLDKVSSSKVIKDIKLSNKKDYIFEFKVPEKLQSISFSVSGKIQNLSQGKKNTLTTTKSFSINKIDNTEQIDSFHIRYANNEYIAELLGKTGEARPEIPVNIEIKHKYFKRPFNTLLQTDKKGRIYLGKLKDIQRVSLSAPNQTKKVFVPVEAKHAYQRIIHGIAGNRILIPIMCNLDDIKSDILSIYEMKNNIYVSSVRDQVLLKNGYLIIDDLAAGNYEIYLKKSQKTIILKLAKGNRVGKLIVSDKRCLELTSPRPVQISNTQISSNKKELVVSLQNVSPTTRVHVIKTRYLPSFYINENLSAPALPKPSSFEIIPPVCRYLSGRKIGDEYRYILERKNAHIFPGNMLKRPGLLLNPWSLRKTDTSTKEAKAGDSWKGAAESSGRSTSGSSGYYDKKLRNSASQSDFTNLDFLPEGSFVATNLVPDENSEVKLDISKIPTEQMICIYVADSRTNAFRVVSLPERHEKYFDLRMAKGLEPTKAFSEQKSICLKKPNEKLIVKDATTSKFEVYDTLSSVYRLYSTLSNDKHLKEFSFILNWPKLSNNKKLEYYSKYSCHELNFFIFKKDKKFFDKVVEPYLVNKRDKTFLDDWFTSKNLNKYLKPWKYQQLNVVEKILLSRKILKQEKANTQRHISDLFNLIAPDVKRANYLFKTALRGRSLETDDKFGLDKLREEEKVLQPAFPPMEDREVGNADEGFSIQSAPMPVVRRRVRPRNLRIARKPMSFARKTIMKNELSFSGGFDDEMIESENSDSVRRQNIRQYFRQLDKTEEWVENNYYKVPIKQQNASLVTVNAFWNDYAANKVGKPFYSTNFAEATGNFTEMMFALSVLDLPFTAKKHKITLDAHKLSFEAASPAIIFIKEIKEAKKSPEFNEILAGQNFFAKNDRYYRVKNERFDKFVTEEFLTWQVYGCQIVLTNPTSSRKKIDVLMQIPNGAIPVQNGFFTKSTHMQLEAFSTKKLEYFFYFPAPGTYKHYPVHVSEDEKTIATTNPFTFKVVNELTKIDTTSWEYVSQNGSQKDVVNYLNSHNIDELNLELIAFRMRDKAFFKQIIELLKNRHVFNTTLWSYALYHEIVPTVKEYLPYTSLADNCGSSLISDLLVVNPVERRQYQHKEYWPLVNARVYPLGGRSEILNKQFSNQYKALLSDLKYHKMLSSYDMFEIAYYLLLQDRIEEAKHFFDKITDKAITDSIQYKYMTAYFDFSYEKLGHAEQIAKEYKDYPVNKWKNLFLDILSQIKEVNGESPTVVDNESRNQQQNKLAETQPEFQFKITENKINVNYQNVKELTVNYYLMDLELLFSRKPFVQGVSGQFSIIKPNLTKVISLDPEKTTASIDIPEVFKDKNAMIEIVGSGKIRSAAHYPHSLRINMIENYGIVKISDEKTNKPLSKVYVKVYCRQKGGNVVFYKDGYTDMRGKFDYASLSTNKLDSVEKFSILIMSNTNGAVVKEAVPPSR